MTEYELMYIVPTSFTDEETGTVEQAVAAMITKAGATTTNTTRLGKFRLAYPIKNQAHGHYVLVRFQSEPKQVAELNEMLRLSPDKVLRHIILRADEAGDEKYQLVQFQEVNVEDRGDRARKPRAGRERTSEEGKVAKEGEEKSTTEEPAKISSEELDKKIDEALEEKA